MSSVKAKKINVENNERLEQEADRLMMSRTTGEPVMSVGNDAADDPGDSGAPLDVQTKSSM